MRQQGWKPSSQGGIGNALIDNMVYAYRPGSNKLAKVTDATDDPMAKMGDFKDGTNSGDDYDYDANGSLTLDNNKNISGITYNHLNLPQTVTVTGKGTIAYTYDATGNKLKKITTDNTVSPAKITTTEYIGGFVYENGELQFTGHEEGRARYAKQYYLNGDSAMTWQWDYFLKDHLGNVRTVLTEQTDTARYAATFETALRAKETALFYNIPETVIAKGATNAPSDPALPAPNDYLSVLEGAAHKVGAAITLKVMAGDKVDMGVRYWYPSYSTVGESNPLSTANLYQTLLNSMSNGTAGLSGGKTTPAHLLGVGSPMPGGLTNYLATQSGEPNTAGQPKAFLNWILLDEQFNYVPGGSGFMRVGGYDAAWRSLATTGLPVAKSGYLFVYLSNETQDEKVFFDNLVVQHYTGPLTEENVYYPFGLAMAGLSSKGVGRVENKRKWNAGSELQSNEFSDGSGLELYSTFYRSLDPQIGRFWQIDPKPDYSQSLYSSMNNNPIKFNDPLGDTVRGSTNQDARRVARFIRRTFRGSEYRELRKLFRASGNTMNSISQAAFNKATANISPEARALANGYRNAINATEVHTVEAVRRGERLKDPNSTFYGHRNGRDVDQGNATTGSPSTGGGFNIGTVGGVAVPEGTAGINGSHTVLVMNSKVDIDDYRNSTTGQLEEGKQTSHRGELLAHEMLGHGLTRFNAGGSQFLNAVQLTNLYHQVGGIWFWYRDGTSHGGTTGVPLDRSVAQDIPSYLR